jgi:hypothetical protein
MNQPILQIYDCLQHCHAGHGCKITRAVAKLGRLARLKAITYGTCLRRCVENATLSSPRKAWRIWELIYDLVGISEDALIPSPFGHKFWDFAFA